MPDVSVVQAGKNLSFSLEPREPIRIDSKRLGQDLQGDLTVQLRISGLIDLSDTPLANEGGHVVMPESGANCQGHSLFRLIWGSFYAQGAHGK